MKLPICTAPIQIHPSPTVWKSAEDAEDWIRAVIELHEGRDERMKSFREAITEPLKRLAAIGLMMSRACPAGDPCPGTGCPACCPDYDPCGEPGCHSCNPTQKGLTMHVPEEAEALDAAADQVPKNTLISKETGRVIDDSGKTYPYQDGDYIVLGPEVFADPKHHVISWQGENYYRHNVGVPARPWPTDKDRELIAANAKATLERRDKERAERLLRETAMHHAVELHKAGLRAGNIPTKSITQSADDILAWLTKS